MINLLLQNNIYLIPLEITMYLQHPAAAKTLNNAGVVASNLSTGC
jgi:hypothetical protein